MEKRSKSKESRGTEPKEMESEGTESKETEMVTCPVCGEKYPEGTKHEHK